jgi:hypothetical protein
MIPKRDFVGRWTRPVPRGVSNEVQHGRRLPALGVGHHRKGRKAVLGVALPQGIKGQGKAGPGESLGSP